MKKLVFGKTVALGATMAAVLLTAGCNEEKAVPASSVATAGSTELVLETTQQKVTYIVGYNMAKQAQSSGLEFLVDVMSQAIQDVNDGTEPRIDDAEQQTIMMAFQEEQQSKREAEQKEKQAKVDEERKVVADANKIAGTAYLEANGKKEGVIVTESGLQYKVLTAGAEGGASPSAEDKVKVHYHGALIDGTVFDSSVDRGEPVTFPVGGVIPGWIEVLQLMKIGDKFEVVIPSELAYKEQGASGKIGGNAVLVFEVELIEINPDTASPH